MNKRQKGRMFEFKTQENQVQSQNQKEKQLWLLDPRDQWARGIPIMENYVNKASTVEEVLFEKQKACRRGYLAENESCWTENLVTCKNSRKDREKMGKKKQKFSVPFTRWEDTLSTNSYLVIYSIKCCTRTLA